MPTDIPPGFAPLDLGAGFTEVFGPIYRNAGARQLGFRVAAHHLNPVGACNGGAMATFADMQIAAFHAGAGTANAHNPTISLSVDYVAPARLGDWVQAEVTLVRSSKSLLFTQAIMAVEGQPVARSTAIYRNYGVQDVER